VDEIKIGWAWGGCGNLIYHCLKSNEHYDLITQHYSKLTVSDTWTNQEWGIRNVIGPVIHEEENTNINLIWENSLDTSFHYIIKNIKINHLDGPILKRVNDVIDINKNFEKKLQRHDHVVLNNILESSSALYDWCQTIDPTLEQHKIAFIYNSWKAKTKLFYEKNSPEVLSYFGELGIDYQPTTLYTILYENSYTRQQQF